MVNNITSESNMDQIEKYHYYINLKKREEKKKKCIHQLGRIGIHNANRFDAIWDKIGLVGCAKSHIQCIENAKRDKWPFICIFEDDVVFTDTEKLQQLVSNYFQSEYDVLFLGAWIRNNQYRIINPDIYQVSYACCAHAYIVKEHYYDILLSNLYEGVRLKEKYPYKNEYNNDEYIQLLQQKDTWLCFNPIMATQLDGYSDNFYEFRNYQKIITDIPVHMDDLPYLSILTPTYNRKQFLPLMILNLQSFIYPKHKLEWIILDSYSKDGNKGEKLLSPNELQQLKQMLNIEINYHYHPHKMSIGQKRNWLSCRAKYDILINVDDDDIYVSYYLQHSVTTLLSNQKECVGSLDMLFIYPEDDYKISLIRCYPDYQLLHEATLCMKKSHWERFQYENSSMGEGRNIYGRKELCGNTSIFKSMICVCWKENTVHKNDFKKNEIKNLIINGESINILKNIFDKNNHKMEALNTKEVIQSAKKSVEKSVTIPEIEKIEITLELLKSIRNLIQVTNDRINWKIEELLPVGIIIKQIDELLKNQNQ